MAFDGMEKKLLVTIPAFQGAFKKIQYFEAKLLAGFRYVGPQFRQMVLEVLDQTIFAQSAGAQLKLRLD